jgi:hypothetical protein
LKTLFHPKKTIVIQELLKRPPASSEYEDKNFHIKGIVVYDQISCSAKSNGFLFDCAHCHSPHQIASKRGNCELKYIKNASSNLGKQK